MKAKDKTRNKIANSAIDLIKRKPLSKMTITDITANCNMTRQIFYKYFIDKYDLIDWIYIQDWNNAIIKIEKEFSFENLLFNLIEIFKEKYEFYYNALKSEDENSLEQLLFDRFLFISSKIVEFSTGEVPTYKIEFLVRANCNSMVCSLINEIRGKMPKPVDQLTEWILDSTPCQVKELLLNHSIPLNMVKQWLKELEYKDE